MTRILATALGMLAFATPAVAGSPGLDAIKEFRSATPSHPTAIENRFFLKADRFELAPVFGYVPNNPFARRFVGGAVLAYHFSEQLAAEGQFTYSPDGGVHDFKGLTGTLVQIAQTGAGDANFQQPLDKVVISAQFAARWAPIYGKINLVGETVVNFDFYGIGGLGIAQKVNYYACAPAGENDPVCPGDPTQRVAARKGVNEVKFTPVIGAGADFFITHGMALKLDLRDALYLDNLPDYDPTDNVPVTRQRLYANLTATVGLGFYFPQMKPRLYNF